LRDISVVLGDFLPSSDVPQSHGGIPAETAVNGVDDSEGVGVIVVVGELPPVEEFDVKITDVMVISPVEDFLQPGGIVDGLELALGVLDVFKDGRVALGVIGGSVYPNDGVFGDDFSCKQTYAIDGAGLHLSAEQERHSIEFLNNI
jgi:hypothetical protein